MKTIWKFECPVQDRFTLAMPLGARTLSFQIQHGNPTLWAMCDSDAPTCGRVFQLLGTGHPIEVSEALEYIGTVQMVVMGTTLVWHLFEVPCLEHSLFPVAPLKPRSESADKYI